MHTDDILQHCLEEVAAGRKTARECAALYPQVPDLLAQLEAAQALQASPPLTLSAAATQRHQAQLRAALAAHRGRAPRPAIWPRWAMAAALVAVLLLGGAGTVRAADGSLPGQALYPVKRTAEAVQGVFVPAAAQAAWHIHLAEKRTAELQALAADPAADPAQLEQAANEIGRETDTALAHIPQAAAVEQAALLQTLLTQIDTQVTVLLAVQARLPAQAQTRLDQAVTASRSNQASAQAQLDAIKHQPGTATQRPPTPTRRAPVATDLPPGQEKKTATAEAQAPAATDLPPGQEKKTATAEAQAPAATATPPGNSDGQGPPATPNCSAGNPNSPNYCTPAPPPPGGAGDGGQTAVPTEAPSGDPPPTPCPLNPAGKPVCSQRP